MAKAPPFVWGYGCSRNVGELGAASTVKICSRALFNSETTHVHSVVHVLHVLHVLTLLSPCIGAVCDNNTNNASVNLGYDRS